MAKRFKKKAAPANKVLSSDRHAVAAVDPGGTTGLFAAVVVPGSTMKQTMLENIELPVELSQCTGDFREQAKLLSEWIKNWFAGLTLDYVAPSNHHVVIENWDTMRKDPGREIISAWIAAGLDCLLTEGMNGPLSPEQITYFMAGQAKGYATNDRLKLWKLHDLTKGKPHARDASRHWCTRVNQLIK